MIRRAFLAACAALPFVKIKICDACGERYGVCKCLRPDTVVTWRNYTFTYSNPDGVKRAVETMTMPYDTFRREELGMTDD